MIYTPHGAVEFFAEIKTFSPDGWRSPYTWRQLLRIVLHHERIIDAISIHVSPRWEGSLHLIERARRHTEKPILAKGINPREDDIRRARDAGATMALVVGRVPKVYAEFCIIEPLSLESMRGIPDHLRVAWNSRDLIEMFRKINGLPPRNVDRPTFSEAREIRPRGWMLQASGIEHMASVEKGADAILVGTHLPKFITSLKAP